MQTTNVFVREQTLFVGIDVHKDTHTAVGINPFGQKLFEMTIGNQREDFQSLLRHVHNTQEATTLAPCFGLEDCHGYGERLADFLFGVGYPVVHVPPILVDHVRQHNTHPEKNDALDAYGVAEVMIHKIDTLPTYTVTEDSKKAKDIKGISLDREYLVQERTRIKNHLHTILHRIHNTEYRTQFKDPFSKKALCYWMRSCPKDVSPFLKRIMQRKVKRLMNIHEEIQELEKDLKQLITDVGHTLNTASGCGVVIAAELIGEIGDINRFHSPASLAKYAGCAPREHSSGKTFRHRKTKAGNRRLNRAFHRMALSQISRSGNEKAKQYFKRKITEGKSKSQALVCLRRQLIPIVWMMMKHKTEYRTAEN